MTAKERAEELVAEFGLFPDWMDKYSYLIELGEEVEPLEENLKTKQNLISGCQSQLWLVANYTDGVINFRADSDAIITKGIARVLTKVFNGASPDEIIEDDLEFLNQIGLKEHLSPTRANGLNSMIKQMKLYALVYKTKYNSAN
jgi:cysteine desulfuration protein SufE